MFRIRIERIRKTIGAVIINKKPRKIKFIIWLDREAVKPDQTNKKQILIIRVNYIKIIIFK